VETLAPSVTGKIPVSSWSTARRSPRPSTAVAFAAHRARQGSRARGSAQAPVLAGSGSPDRATRCWD